MSQKVYFTRDITPKKVVELYRALGVELPGKVAVKVHSGRRATRISCIRSSGSPWWRAVHGTIVECNTAYGDATGGVRDNTESHLKLLEDHGWTKYFDVDLIGRGGSRRGLAHPQRKGPQGKSRGQKYHALRPPCWYWPTSRATPWAATGRGPEATGHRLRLPGRQGADPLRRRHRRPV